MPEKTFIDIHLIQTVPFSNLNRDDTGSPKTGTFGGVTRARVSSQAQKHAVRDTFAVQLPAEQLGTRSKRWPKIVSDRIADLAPEIDAEVRAELAKAVLEAVGFKIPAVKAKKDEEAPEPQTQYLVFLGNRQLDRLAQAAVESHRTGEKLDKKQLKPLADTDQAVDIALFGRMLADAADLNVDAAAQVAHAVSVHAVDNEWDFFTAVDDEAPADNLGAGMMGTIEFNSSTLYRYASVNARALASSLGDTANAAQVVGAFVRAFATTLPSGKSNTFANFTLPEAIVVTVRRDQPVNFVGAFETAVVPSADGRSRAEVTAARLASYAADVEQAYGNPAVASYVVRLGEATAALDEIGERTSLPELVASLERVVGERLTEHA